LIHTFKSVFACSLLLVRLSDNRFLHGHLFWIEKLAIILNRKKQAARQAHARVCQNTLTIFSTKLTPKTPFALV
jgi:hypothetical protein